MAAGLGVRMRPLTDALAKPLVPVRGVPLVETVLAALETLLHEQFFNPGRAAEAAPLHPPIPHRQASSQERKMAMSLAYIGPSVMSYTVQAIAGVAIALGVVFGVVWRKIKRGANKALAATKTPTRKSKTTFPKSEAPFPVPPRRTGRTKTRSFPHDEPDRKREDALPGVRGAWMSRFSDCGFA